MKKVTHYGELKIADITLPCYVTEDGVRILSSRRMQVALNIVDERTGKQSPGKRLDRFFNYKAIKSLIATRVEIERFKPIPCKYGSTTIKGYEATILPDICSIMLEARRKGLIDGIRQNKIADRCEILLGGLAKIGIIALVDEATGYQEIRDRKALQALLDKYLRKELAIWAKRFPDDFYKEMFRLRNWQWKGMSVNRPSFVGKLTKDIVYERLAPTILKELEKRNPKTERGRRRHRHHQWLTDDIGLPALERHLYAVVGLMRASANWHNFQRMLQRAFPKKGEQFFLDMEVEDTTTK